MIEDLKNLIADHGRLMERQHDVADGVAEALVAAGFAADVVEAGGRHRAIRVGWAGIYVGHVRVAAERAERGVAFRPAYGAVAVPALIGPMRLAIEGGSAEARALAEAAWADLHDPRIRHRAFVAAAGKDGASNASYGVAVETGGKTPTSISGHVAADPWQAEVAGATRLLELGVKHGVERLAVHADPRVGMLAHGERPPASDIDLQFLEALGQGPRVAWLPRTSTAPGFALAQRRAEEAYGKAREDAFWSSLPSHAE